jgi:hypothetical protein
MGVTLSTPGGNEGGIEVADNQLVACETIDESTAHEDHGHVGCGD